MSHEEGGGPGRDDFALPLLAGEKIEAVYQEIAFLCPFSSPGDNFKKTFGMGGSVENKFISNKIKKIYVKRYGSIFFLWIRIPFQWIQFRYPAVPVPFILDPNPLN